MSDDLATWLRAVMDALESDAQAFLELHPHLPDWPQLALAEVKAKRRILALHQRVDARDDWPGRGRDNWPLEPACYGCHANFSEEYAVPDANDCPVVRLLAEPYASEPGYRDEWRPEPA